MIIPDSLCSVMQWIILPMHCYGSIFLLTSQRPIMTTALSLPVTPTPPNTTFSHAQRAHTYQPTQHTHTHTHTHTDSKLMAWNYIKTWFMLEFISTLPYDLFVFHPIWEHAVLRLPRLLRLLKTQYYFSIWEQRAKIPVIISLIKLLVCFPYL